MTRPRHVLDDAPPASAIEPQPLLPPLFPGWPGPPPPPSRAVLGAAAVAGAAAGLTVPDGRPGVGALVLAVVLAVLTWAVRWHVRQSLSPVVVDAGWTAAAIGFAGVAAVRDAEWLVTVALLAAAVCGSVAVAGRSFRSMAVAAVAVPVAALRGLPWVVRGVRDAGAGGGAARVIGAALVGLGLVAVFGGLLAEADAAFGAVVALLKPAVYDVDGVARWVWLAGLGAVGMIGACFLLAAPPEPGTPREVPPSRLRTVEWALPIGLVVAVFALFGAVQVAALLGGDGYVQRTAGLTYADYARSGFWQLLAVTVLALGVVLAGSRWVPHDTRPRWRRGLLAALTVLTLVIVATAVSRMWLYQQAYGFTVLRLLVLVCEGWLGAGFVLVLRSVLRAPRSGGRPVRAMVVTGVVLLLRWPGRIRSGSWPSATSPATPRRAGSIRTTCRRSPPMPHPRWRHCRNPCAPARSSGSRWRPTATGAAPTPPGPPPARSPADRRPVGDRPAPRTRRTWCAGR